MFTHTSSNISLCAVRCNLSHEDGLTDRHTSTQVRKQADGKSDRLTDFTHAHKIWKCADVEDQWVIRCKTGKSRVCSKQMSLKDNAGVRTPLSRGKRRRSIKLVFKISLQSLAGYSHILSRVIVHILSTNISQVSQIQRSMIPTLSESLSDEFSW